MITQNRCVVFDSILKYPRLQLSDGRNTVTGFLSSSLSPLATDGKIVTNSILRVEALQVNTIVNRTYEDFLPFPNIDVLYEIFQSNGHS